MIKFFRHIRQRLLSENKFSKYLLYALGEIVLVVLGILIAFQINKWNEERKNNQLLEVSIDSLLVDLKKDSGQLADDLGRIQMDIDILDDFIARLSKPTATMDTLRHIARFEYFPFFNPSNELNRNTIVSLLNTGKIDLFDEKLKTKILEHNSQQIISLKVMDQNVSIFLNSRDPYVINLQSENEIFESAFIKGKLLDEYWENKDDNRLMDAMLSSITGKKLMQEIIKNEKKAILERTDQMIATLENF